MLPITRHRVSLAATLIAFGLSAHAEFYMSGNIGLRSQQVDRDGAGNSPFNGVEKNHFGHSNLRAEWEMSPYRILTTQLDISAQRSDLSDPRDEIRVNRAALDYENGEGILPYRAQAGDIYALYSPRALRRNLKGAMLDLQPMDGHSIQLLAGLDSAAWDQGGYANRYTGASWLMDTRGFGEVSLNYVFSEDDQHANEQRTTSIGWFNSIGGNHHQLDWEAELLHQSNTADDGEGVFVEGNARLFENQTRLNLTFERYDEFFAPRGAVISAGQKRWLASLSQRVGDSYLTLDAQDFKSLTFDNRERNYNASYSLNFGNGLIANLRAGDREQASFGATTRTDSQGLQLSYSINPSHGIDFGWQGVDSKTRFTGSNSHSRSNDWSLGSRSTGTLWGGTWRAAPALVWRDLDSQSLDSREFAPSLTLGFRRNNHDLQVHYGSTARESEPLRASEQRNRNRRLSLAYSYRRHNTQWRLEAGRFVSHNHFLGEQQEDSVVLSVDHQFSIDSRGRSLLRSEFRTPGVVDPILALSELIGKGEFVLAQDVALSVNPASRQHLADQSRYDGHFIVGDHTPQQLVLERQGRFLGEAHLSIDLQGMNSERARRLYETLQAYLHRRFGAPQQQRQSGDFDGSLQQAVQSGELVRLMQWQIGTSVLRFGLPQTLDGHTRLQISLKGQFNSTLEGIWQG